MAGAFFCGRWRDSFLYACGKPEQDDLKWLRVRCAIISGKIFLIFANQENLRIFLICFFTRKVVMVNGIYCR